MDDSVADAVHRQSKQFVAQVEDTVANHIDPYPFVIEVLGAVFRGAARAKNMGGDEPRAVGAMCDTIGSIIADDDPASLPLYEGKVA